MVRIAVSGQGRRTDAVQWCYKSMEGQFLLIYDDACPICTRAVDRVRNRDALRVIRPVGLNNLDRETIDVELPSDAHLRQAMHLVSPRGEVRAGIDAVTQLLAVLPRGRFLSTILSLPVIRRVARWMYAMIAANRLRLSRLMPSDR